MFYNDIKEKLNNLKQSDELQPDQDWKEENKQALLSEIESETEKEEQNATILEKLVSLCDLVLPQRVVAAGQMTAFVFFIVFAAVGGWSVTVQASYSSVPGDTLYNVKLAAEQAQLTVTEVVGSEAEEAKLHSEFAARRAEEVKKIIKNEDDPEKAKKAIEKMNKSLNKAQNSLKQAGESGNNSTAESTQKVLSNNKVIQNTLSRVLVDVSNGSPSLVNDIIVVQGEITSGSLNILEYMVRSQLQGKVDLSKEETKALVVETISALSKDSVESDVVAESLDSDAVEQIAEGVVDKIEEKNGGEFDSGLKREVHSKEDKEKSDKKEKDSSEIKSSSESKKTKTNEEEETKTNNQEQEKSKQKTDTSTKKIATTSSSKTASTSVMSTTSSDKSINIAKKLAKKGKLLKAIQKAQNISSQNNKEMLDMVQKSIVDKKEKKKGEVFVELNNGEKGTITTTVQYNDNDSREEDATSSEKNSTTSSKKQEEKSKKEDNKKNKDTEETKEKDGQEKNKQADNKDKKNASESEKNEEKSSNKNN